MLTTYESTVFDSLNHFQDARQFLGKHMKALKEAGALICKHKLERKVGLGFLHKHFKLSPHERLVESKENGKIYINPTIEANDATTIPYLWKLDCVNLTQNPSWFPLEFQYRSAAKPDDIETVESLAANSNFLEEMAVKLQNYGVEDVFGLCILHRETVPLKEGEILVETTDYANRSLMITALRKSDIQHEDLTETLWYFTADTNLGVAGQCVSHCIQHCVSHN